MRYSLLILLVTLVTDLQAQWSSDSTLNNPICTATDYQYNSQLIENGNGGAIIVWADRRSGTGGTTLDIYSQLIDADGFIQWTVDGILVCGASSGQSGPQLVSDGSGGVIIVWDDLRSGNMDIYAQRINSEGIPQWTADGIPICSAANNQSASQIISDENGGAIIVWLDYRSGFGYDIYAQRVDANGNTLWTVDGIVICSAVNEQSYHQIINDGNGGAIIVWQDERAGVFDIYAQKIDVNGNVLWQANGVRVCTEANDQWNSQIISDGIGGAFIVWRDIRNAVDWDIYAQRINQDGTRLWDTSGVAICLAAEDQFFPQLVSDLNGGAIICWEDNRTVEVYYDIFAQRIDENGNLMWNADGVPICTADNTQRKPELISNDMDGAIIIWQDHRRVFEDDVYAQRIDVDGNVLWESNGVAISVADRDQSLPHLIKDGNNGAIIIWDDNREYGHDVYCSLVTSDGQLAGGSSDVTGEGQIPIAFKVFQNYPNPFNPFTVISYQLPVSSNVTIKVFDILGREVATLVNEYKPAGKYEFEFNATNLPSGVYFYQLKAGTFIETKKMLLLK